MARSRKRSLSERVKQRRLSSLPPNPREPAPREPLRVAPLPPLPIIEPTAESAPVTAKPKPAIEDASPAEIEPSLAPVATKSERPTSMRRGLVVLAAAVAVVAIAVGISRSRARARRATEAAATAAHVATAPPPPPAMPPHSAEPAASTAPPPAATASVAAVPSAPSAEPGPSAAPSASAAGEPQSASALRDQALELLKEAKNPEAMAAASEALDADPSDAMPYLVLGSALQDTGRWREAHRTYELCVKHATKGMTDECRAMLRRK